MIILRFFYWFSDRALGTCLTLFFLSLLSISAFAQRTYDVENAPQMYLDTSITNTQTTGIIIASPQRNGSDYLFTTTTGGVLRIRSGFKVEDIRYTSASVSSTTNKITLTGVTRNLCTPAGRNYITCGNGQYFSKGSIVELNFDKALINLKLNYDRKNTLTGSGQIRSAVTSHPILIANSVTTTQRDNMTAADIENGAMIYNSTLGVMQQRAGGNWLSFGSGTTVNATTLVSGKVETATGSDLYRFVWVGDSGAPLVLSTQNVIQTSSGSSMSGRVLLSNEVGFLDIQTGGTGTGSFLTGALLIGSRRDRIRTLDPTTNSGDMLRSDGVRWLPINPPTDVICSTTTTASDVGASTLVETIINSCTLGANSVAVGDQLIIEASGDARAAGTNGSIKVRIGGVGGVVVASGALVQSSATTDYMLRAVVVVRNSGASGTAAGSLNLLSTPNFESAATGQNSIDSRTASSIDWTAAQVIALTFDPSSSDASTRANTEIFTITRISP